MIELVTLLVMCQMTIACVTLYLHRGQAHRSVAFHPAVAHVMRFWLWLTTGMVTREWVAVHRRHHQRSDQAGDPHSPQVFGIWSVLLGGAWLYARAAQDRDMVRSLSHGTPDDWIEQHLYSRYSWLGITVLLAVLTLIFGWWGLAMWTVQMLWVPFWAAGVINGLAHWWGYRNNNTPDTSRNLWPWAVWIGGEELHNNHHSDGASARFSQEWWELDIGWFYIRVLEILDLARVRR